MRQRSLLAAVLPLVLFLWGFTPFTKVTNVCPKCKQPPSDVVVLNNGFQIPCRLIAQNNDYYVVARHGEHRAVPKAEVSSIRWKSGSGPSDLATGDQILLKNGVLLHGTIGDVVGGRHITIQVGTLRHVAWNSQIKSVHRAGAATLLEEVK
jgi:hypothetical protein